MTAFLLQTCAVQRSFALFNDRQHLTQVHYKALVSRATAAAARLQRRRRAHRVPSTLLQKRRALHGTHSLQRLLQRRLDMASHQEIRRRSSAADRNPISPAVSASATTTTFATPPEYSRTRQGEARAPRDGTDAEAMPPPPLPQDDDVVTRQSRSTSTASRNANRLSLTLPIALPTSDPSRPTPTSATPTSVPPTPDSAVMASPSNANEFIIAIAAQERKVLELREELSRAESQLSSLKKQWTAKDSYHKRTESLSLESPRRVAPIADEETPATRHSIDLNHRKLMLQNQGTPTSNRRRVLRGGHARTLSLLSPPKSDVGFSVLEDHNEGPISLPRPPVERRTPPSPHPGPSKRASWGPRAYQNSPAMPQMVEDFKLGLRTFMEDIRQVTMGDDAVGGQLARSQSVSQRPVARDAGGDQDTIRPAPAARAKASSAFDTSAPTTTPTRPSTSRDAASREKGKMTKNKHFSWTPLGFDSLDDSDWSNWGESPASTKSARWSGSTMNSNGVEDIEPVAERVEGSPSPTKVKPPTIDTPLLSPKLEEILPNVVNRLSPSNIKRTANNLMTEWEKSLVPPETRDKENSG